MEAVLFNSLKKKKKHNTKTNKTNKKNPTAKGQQEQNGCNQIATKSCCPDLPVFAIPGRCLMLQVWTWHLTVRVLPFFPPRRAPTPGSHCLGTVSFTQPSAEAPTRTCMATTPQPQVSFFTQEQTTERHAEGAGFFQCSTCSAQWVTKLLLDLMHLLKLPAGASAIELAESSRTCWTWCPHLVKALPAQSWSQFGWAGDQERANAMLKAWMRLSMSKTPLA